jgi:hypothetical protein
LGIVDSSFPKGQVSTKAGQLLTWVDWFNNRRLFEPIGNVPPVVVEQAYYQLHKVQAVAA